jgi:hypothetical protein
MNCAKARKILPLFAGGEIDPSLRQDTERHLAQCSECRQALKEYATIVELSRSAPPVEISDEIGKSLVLDIIAQSRDSHPDEFKISHQGTSRKKYRFGYRLAGVTAVVAIALIAVFIAFGTQFMRSSRGPSVEDYLMHSDLRGLSNALREVDSRERLLDESVPVDLLIQTVENLQRKRTFHARIEHQIANSLREIKTDLRDSPTKQPQSRSLSAPALAACAKTDDDRIRLEKILSTLRCLRRSDDRVTVRDILHGLTVADET